jgi:hypothetical protein
MFSFQMTACLVARDWNDVVAVRQPGQSELRYSHCSDLRDGPNKNALAGLCCRCHGAAT